MKNKKGFTLIEIMVMLMIVSIFFISVSGVFTGLAKGIFLSKTRTIATNLVQEKIEYLKDFSYSRLIVTNLTDLVTYGYDKTYYPPEDLVVGDISFTRTVLIDKVKEENVQGKDRVTAVPPDSADTGLKRITITVTWKEAGQTKTYSFSNLFNDPNRVTLNSKIYGTIKDIYNVPINRAYVVVLQNLNWDAYTGSDGKYEIPLTSGTYNVRISKEGYLNNSSPDIIAPANDSGIEYSPKLTQRVYGNAIGYVFIADHLTIGLVVASSQTDADEQEWVQLINPTTYTWTMNSSTIKLKYVDADNNITDIPLTFIRTPLLKGKPYVIANREKIICNWGSITPDAMYQSTGSNIIQENDAGGIIITDGNDKTIDKVGWSKTGSGKQAPSKAVEKTPVALAGGIGINSTLLRLKFCDNTYNWCIFRGGGYDANNNDNDFVYLAYTDWPDYSISGAVETGAGTPAYGATITCNDEKSTTVSSSKSYTSRTGYSNRETAFFDIQVPTGTYTITISSGNYAIQISNVIIEESKYTGIPNSITSPPWTTPDWFLDSYYHYTTILKENNIYGYISGQVVAGGIGIAGIKVAAGNSYSYTSGLYGAFTIAVDSGTYVVIANPNYENANYIEQPAQNGASFLVSPGMSVNVGIIDLSKGGAVHGKVVSASGDPIDGIVIQAESTGPQTKVTTLTGADGTYSIQGLSVPGSKVYTVSPQLDTAETSTPEFENKTVTTGSDLAVTTFVVSNAFGKFTGSVYDGTNLIKTGVLIIATTGTIAADPPVMNSAFRSGGSIHYGTISKGDGTYEILVRAGYNYNIYAWYTKIANKATVTTRKNKTGKTVTAGNTATADFGPGTGADGW